MWLSLTEVLEQPAPIRKAQAGMLTPRTVRASEPSSAPNGLTQTRRAIDTLGGSQCDTTSDCNHKQLRAYLQYFKDVSDIDKEKPYVSKIPPPLSQPKPPINFTGSFHETVITDIRGYEDHFSLDCHGFQFERHVSQHASSSHDLVQECYLNEMRDWLKDYASADEVFVFDYVVRG